LKKPEFGQSISIVANLGVIAGIVFLGYELQQNNRLLEAEARLASHQGGQEFAASLAHDPELAAILAKEGRGEPLTDAEEIQVYALGLAVLRSFQYTYQEMTRGALAAEDYSVEPMRVIYHANRLDYRLDETWKVAKRTLEPGFVEHFEVNVINRPFE